MRSQRLEKPCERFCSFDKGLCRLKGKAASCASPGATRPQANLQITRMDEVGCRFVEPTVSHLPEPLQTLRKPPAAGQRERKQKSRRIRRLYAGFCGFYRIAGGGGDGSRTHVRKEFSAGVSGCRRSTTFPPHHADRQANALVAS